MHNRGRPSLTHLVGALAIGTTLITACGSSSPGLQVTRSADASTTGTDQVTTEPAGTDPVTTDPAGTEPVSTDPVTTDPAGTEPASTDPEATDTPTTDKPTMDLPDSTVPLDGPFPFDPDKPPQPFDGLMVATVNDLVQWWGEEMPRVFGAEYPPLEGGVFPAYPERTQYPAPGCFEKYEEIAGNGFYCPVGDYIVWDDTNYAVPNYQDHGSGAITGLMSHEWGHAIQARTGVFAVTPRLPTVIVELQADCCSGAWFAHIARGESDLLSFSDADIRSGLIDTVLAADPVGTTPDIDGAHGAGFDRVG
ncbi:MAG: hypothetical protein ABIW84_03415, partial [Ilumatobacteraceae bacterium]